MKNERIITAFDADNLKKEAAEKKQLNKNAEGSKKGIWPKALTVFDSAPAMS